MMRSVFPAQGAKSGAESRSGTRPARAASALKHDPSAVELRALTPCSSHQHHTGRRFPSEVARTSRTGGANGKGLAAAQTFLWAVVHWLTVSWAEARPRAMKRSSERLARYTVTRLEQCRRPAAVACLISSGFLHPVARHRSKCSAISGVNSAFRPA
jgi:hypothetical protein